ncbi:MAG: ISL3 family transposase [Dermatophilaceae bacterium]
MVTKGEVTGLVQRTHARGRAGQRSATLLLGIEGLAVASVDLEEGGGRVVAVVTDELGAAACPDCGVISTSVKGRATTRPRDVPYGEAPIRLVWHKTRWRCREQACPRGSFTESLPSVPARSRLTTRLRVECGERIATDASCVQAAADRYRVSWPVAHAAYVTRVDAQLATPLPLVAVLGIDETRRGKPVWAQDPLTCRWRIVTDRWLTGIVDAAGTGGLLGHVDGRTAATVADWLREQPQGWREAITHVCIDLSASYAKAVTDALPGAVLVADRFHLVRLGNEMVTDVRQRVTRADRGRRGGKHDPEWASRRRLLTAHERLSPDSFARMWNGLIDQGDLGIEILHAYAVKENLRQLLALAPTPGTSGPGPVGHLPPVVALPGLGRCHRQPRSPPPGRDHRSVVARDRSQSADRLHQRSIGGLQPARETPRTQRLRLPQHRQPTPPHTLGLHSSTPASLSYDQRDARSSSMSRERSR